MGNSEEDFCGHPLYSCNIFEMKNKYKRNSLSLPKNNYVNENKSSKNTTEKEIRFNESNIENGAKSINITNFNNYKNIRIEPLKKFILLNPEEKGNNYLHNAKNYHNNGILTNKNLNKDNIHEEENTIINNSFDSIDSINIPVIENKKSNKFNEIKEKESNSLLNKSIKHSHKSNEKKEEDNENNEKRVHQSNENKGKDNNILIENIKFAQQLDEKKEKDNKNIIHYFKSNNDIYSENYIDKANDKKTVLTQKGFKRPKLKKSISTKNVNINKFNSSHSIPEIHHQEQNNPLNLLLIKKQIKCSRYPLNNDKSFNIITYKEDDSKQYSNFDKGLASGATKYIIDKKNNIIFEGEFQDGYPKGYGKYSLKKEGRYYEGIWDKSILIGIETWKDGTLYIGEYRDNKKEGVGMYQWPNGTIYYGELKNDVMDGFCSIQFTDDRKYEGQMINGVKSGYGEFTWKNVRKYIGNYENDLKEGFGIYIWNIKIFQVYIGFWHKGKMEGIGMVINDNKRHYGKWLEGKKIESYEDEKDFKLKNCSKDLINQKRNEKNKYEKNRNDKLKINETKNELERFINFMSKDIKSIKKLIVSLFFKSNEFS